MGRFAAADMHDLRDAPQGATGHAFEMVTVITTSPTFAAFANASASAAKMTLSSPTTFVLIKPTCGSRPRAARAARTISIAGPRRSCRNEYTLTCALDIMGASPGAALRWLDKAIGFTFSLMQNYAELLAVKPAQHKARGLGERIADAVRTSHPFHSTISTPVVIGMIPSHKRSSILIFSMPAPNATVRGCMIRARISVH
jgi:hypothetical protein